MDFLDSGSGALVGSAVGDTVFLSYMGMPGTVRDVVDFDGLIYGYVIEAFDGYGTDVFRLDEVEEFDADKWDTEAPEDYARRMSEERQYNYEQGAGHSFEA